jgi:hypothetical protein
VIPKAKITALREVLERDGEVVFKNGSIVRREIAGTVIAAKSDQKFHLRVIRPAGGIARYPDDDSGLRAAYAMALNGPAPKAQPSGDGSKLGDDPPF